MRGPPSTQRKGQDGKARTSIASHLMWLPMLGHSGDVASIAGALRLKRVYRENAFLSTDDFECHPACLLHAVRYRTQGPFYHVWLPPQSAVAVSCSCAAVIRTRAESSNVIYCKVPYRQACSLVPCFSVH